MISSVTWFETALVREKIRDLPEALALALSQNSADASLRRGPIDMARDVSVVKTCQLPPKPGLSKVEGQARLLHDLASIELQAMELGVRTLHEFPEAPKDFREQLADVTFGEARHLGLCLDGLNALGYEWGHWDVHIALLNTVSHEDTLLDRILIVHRYLEGSGLDASDGIMKKLNGVGATLARPVVATILREEVDHVLFGSRWYRKICAQMKLDPSVDFSVRMKRVLEIAPRREHINEELRLKAGFTPGEIMFLKEQSFHMAEEHSAQRLKVKNGNVPPGTRPVDV